MRSPAIIVLLIFVVLAVLAILAYVFVSKSNNVTRVKRAAFIDAINDKERAEDQLEKLRQLALDHQDIYPEMSQMVLGELRKYYRGGKEVSQW